MARLNPLIEIARRLVGLVKLRVFSSVRGHGHVGIRDVPTAGAFINEQDRRDGCACWNRAPYFHRMCV